MEFRRQILRRHFAGKPVVASRIVVRFLRLLKTLFDGTLLNWPNQRNRLDSTTDLLQRFGRGLNKNSIN